MNYVPPSTRAVLARLGINSRMDLGHGEIYDLSVRKMPGEVKWRADYLMWLRATQVYALANKPKEQWAKHAHQAMDLLREISLHPAERDAVVLGALDEVRSKTDAELEQMKLSDEVVIEILRLRKQMLNSRFIEILHKHATRVGSDDDSVADGDNRGHPEKRPS